MAHALTAVRLLLVIPVAVAFAQPTFLPPSVLAVLLGVAIASDFLDGRVARVTGTASATGQLFDHTTDFLFVTVGLSGAAFNEQVTPLLPVVIVVAFGQYVFDSYFLFKQKQLRMSAIGRWNGVLYFAPLVILAASRLELFRPLASFLTVAATAVGYVLVVSTAVSIIDRAVAPLRPPR